MGVVREDIVHRIAVLSDGYDLQPHVFEDEALLLLAPKSIFSPWRSVMVRSARVAFVGCKGGMGLVVEYHAVLHHLNHRHALVHGCGHDALLRELHLHVDRPREEGSLAPITSSPGLNGFSTVP